MSEEKVKEKGEQLERLAEVKPAPEVQHSAVIDGNVQQDRWKNMERAHYLEQDESATGLFYKSGEARPTTEKFQLFDNAVATGKSDILKGRIEQTQTIEAEPLLSNTPNGWLTAGQKIAKMPPEVQAQIIGAGLMAGIEQHQQQEQEKRFGALIGSIQGVGNVAANLAKIADFSTYCVKGDQENAAKMGEEFGTALGETTVSGVRLYQAADKYLFDIGYTGDFAKPIKDVAVVGNMLNEQWSKLTPLEQERRKYQLITEMTAQGLLGVGGAQAIGKAKKFTEVLDVVAEQGANSGVCAIDASENAATKVAGLVRELNPFKPQQQLVTPEGVTISQSGETHKLGDFIAKMVGRTGEYIPERKPMFLAPGRNKVLNECEIETFGGLKRLETMSDGELAGIGLRRFEMPKLKLETDEFSVKATIPGYPRTYFRAEVPSPGVVRASDLYRGELPEGTGGMFFAEALKAHGVLPTKQLILPNIINKETRQAFKSGVLPEETLVARSAIKALNKLGIQVKSCSYDWKPYLDQLNIVIETGR